MILSEMSIFSNISTLSFFVLYTDKWWGDESVVDALRKLIPFLFRSFCNRLIFKLKKIGGTKTGSQLATLSVIFSSAQINDTHFLWLSYLILITGICQNLKCSYGSVNPARICQFETGGIRHIPDLLTSRQLQALITCWNYRHPYFSDQRSPIE